MSIIKIMNENLSNKIAAGEIIEKCASVVKELVENSIDANSAHIKVELLDAGTREITIIDDGCGMDIEDVKTCFIRHATSKLLKEEDLYNINTLGFRGEALPSIASVSDIIMKSSNGISGTEINFKAGQMINCKVSDLRVGTQITVKNLFYNVPARLKYLKSLTTELTNIIDYINRLAMTRPDISFSLSNNGKILLKTDGSNDLLKVINSIYGYDVTKKMIKFDNSNNDYHISGYMSYPEVNRASRKYINCIVNKRTISNSEINKTINEAYHTYKAENRYPIVVLIIETDPFLVDVNIHPTKQDIKFSKIEELKELIFTTFQKKLKELVLIPSIETASVVSSTFTDSFIQEDYISTVNLINEIHEINVKPKEQTAFNLEVRENLTEYNDDKKVMKELYPIGLIHGTYIVCQNENAMYLIDQHAANERINYEKYFKALGNPSKQISDLLIPISIELPTDEAIILKEKLNILEEMGIHIEEFGINTFIVKTTPIWLKEGYEEESVNRIIELIILFNNKFAIDKFNEKISMTLACKLSIKANQKISLEEMQILISKLKECENPWTCPHGRPTIIEFTNYELEKLFKRSV